MEKQLIQFIRQNDLIASGEKTLIAASGGVDSTVLCHLYARLKLPFAIAHCNFQLRGKASDNDEAFVSGLAKSFGVKFYSQKFDTNEFAARNKLSIQEAARDLRYEWLANTMNQAGCQVIATAHHIDDSVETLFINLAKGCGLRGLHGILPKKASLVRPLLFATKAEVLGFAQREKIDFREDQSNATDKYTRNKIRHQVIPVLESINPGFIKNAGATITRIRQAVSLFDYALEAIKREIYTIDQGQHLIDIPKLLACPAPPIVLYEMLKDFGFNKSQVVQILAALDGQPGKIFETPGRKLVIDREFISIVERSGPEGARTLTSLQESPILLEGGKLSFSILDGKPANFTKDKNTAFLDYDKINFPLKLRHWQAGDTFQPFGMGGGHQKIQDFFTNQKVNRLDKGNIWLLESGGEICWVVGMRINERYKVTAFTKRCLVAVLEPGIFVPGKPET